MCDAGKRASVSQGGGSTPTRGAFKSNKRIRRSPTWCAAPRASQPAWLLCSRCACRGALSTCLLLVLGSLLCLLRPCKCSCPGRLSRRHALAGRACWRGSRLPSVPLRLPGARQHLLRLLAPLRLLLLLLLLLLLMMMMMLLLMMLRRLRLLCLLLLLCLLVPVWKSIPMPHTQIPGNPLSLKGQTGLAGMERWTTFKELDLGSFARSLLMPLDPQQQMSEAQQQQAAGRRQHPPAAAAPTPVLHTQQCPVGACANS